MVCTNERSNFVVQINCDKKYMITVKKYFTLNRGVVPAKD